MDTEGTAASQLSHEAGTRLKAPASLAPLVSLSPRRKRGSVCWEVWRTHSGVYSWGCVLSPIPAQVIEEARLPALS